MFSFFKKKAAAPAADPAVELARPDEPVTSPADQDTWPAPPPPPPDLAPNAPATPAKRSWFERLRDEFIPSASTEPDVAARAAAEQRAFAPTEPFEDPISDEALEAMALKAEPEPDEPAPPAPTSQPSPSPLPPAAPPERRNWFEKLRTGLRKTGSSISQVFTGAQIDDALYEELEAALLMADAGVKATAFLLEDLKRRVKEARATDAAAVKALLVDAITALLRPLEKALQVGRFTPTVFMVVGVNGAGKTTSIGKLTRHLAEADQKVLLAAADTFRAAAREQLEIWADRNQVEIISQQGGDPAAVSFDAVTAGKARGCDVVIADTAGRLPTQIHLMEELKKIKRVIAKADAGAPHEILLVVDGNTGQNALTQVKAFDEALGLTGLIITKLDGTAKGGVLAAIARENPIPVYFIGVGEKLEDLQTFDAREFAQALIS